MDLPKITEVRIPSDITNLINDIIDDVGKRAWDREFTPSSDSNNGARGLVPMPKVGENHKALFGDRSYKYVVQSVNGVKATPTGAIEIVTVPVGTILPFAGNEIPKGFLPCNHGAISRTTYARLFGVIGTWYGSGDGVNTFNLPDLEDNRFLQFVGYSGMAMMIDAGLPNITGVFASSNDMQYYPSFYKGAFKYEGLDTSAWYANDRDGRNVAKISFSANRSSSIYGNSYTVQPKALTVRAIIKY